MVSSFQRLSTAANWWATSTWRGLRGDHRKRTSETPLSTTLLFESPVRTTVWRQLSSNSLFTTTYGQYNHFHSATLIALKVCRYSHYHHVRFNGRNPGDPSLVVSPRLSCLPTVVLELKNQQCQSVQGHWKYWPQPDVAPCFLHLPPDSRGKDHCSVYTGSPILLSSEKRPVLSASCHRTEPAFCYYSTNVTASQYFILIHRVKWRHISVVSMRSPFCRSTRRTVCS